MTNQGTGGSERANSELPNRLVALTQVDADGLRAFTLVPFVQVTGQRFVVVQDGAVKTSVASEIAVDFTDEGARRKLVGLSMLGHDVANVDALRLGGPNGFRNAADQKIGNDTGIEISRSQHDEIGFFYGPNCLGVGGRSRIEIHLLDRHLVVCLPDIDVSLTAYHVAVRKARAQHGTVQGDGQHSPLDSQKIAGLVNRTIGGTQNIGQCRK